MKYRRSILGVLWTLLNPLLMMTVLSIVFSNLFKFDIENFPLYLLCGQVIFNFFNDATTNAMSAIIGSAPLIKKVYVPKYVFVMSRGVFQSDQSDVILCSVISDYDRYACGASLDNASFSCATFCWWFWLWGLD